MKWWRVYESLTPLNEVDLNEHIVRGQYTASIQRKDIVKKKVNPSWITLQKHTSLWSWVSAIGDGAGVPFYIRTGKQMPTKVAEIVVHFKETPHQVFHSADGNEHPMANKLILRLQPNEGIVLKFGMKMPGPGLWNQISDHGL